MARAAVIKDSTVTNVVVASEEYAVSKGWIVSDDAHIGDTYNAETGEFTRTEPEPESVPPTVALYTYKTDVWKRMSEDEAEQFKAEMEAAGAKYQGMWNDAQLLEHDDPYFEMLRNSMIDVYGEDRTDELLAPSEEG